MATRRLWWRHPMSVLAFPATMTLFIPALILAFAGVDAPDLDTASGWLLVIAGGVLIALGLGLLVWTVVLFDRVGEGTLGVGEVMGEPVNLVVRGLPARPQSDDDRGVLHPARHGRRHRIALAARLVRAVLHDHGDRHPHLRGTSSQRAVRRRVRGLPPSRAALDSTTDRMAADPIMMIGSVSAHHSAGYPADSSGFEPVGSNHVGADRDCRTIQ
jgi:hypothetical protein